MTRWLYMFLLQKIMLLTLLLSSVTSVSCRYAENVKKKKKSRAL